MFVMTANPSLELLTRLISEHLDAVVHEPKTDPLGCPLVNDLQTSALLLNDFVPSPSIHEKDDGIRIGEDRFVLRPAVEDNVRLDVGNMVQALGQQLDTGVELVHAGWMRRFSGHQHDFLYFRHGSGGRRGCEPSHGNGNNQNSQRSGSRIGVRDRMNSRLRVTATNDGSKIW